MNFYRLIKIFLAAAIISVLLFIFLYIYGVRQAAVPSSDSAEINNYNNIEEMISETDLNDYGLTEKNIEVIAETTNQETNNNKSQANSEAGGHTIDKSAFTSLDNSGITKSEESSNIILHTAPFTAQAPFAEWSDSRQQDGCEEAASLMAVKWAQGENLTLAESKEEILEASVFELENYGSYIDTSASATAKRIITGYFNYNNYSIKYDIGLDDIVHELVNGNVLIIPMNGRALGNPYYTAPGPDRHMLLVKGYDYNTRELITNDNGTRHGEDYRYDQDIFFSAIRDYPSGDGAPIKNNRKAMIIIKP